MLGDAQLGPEGDARVPAPPAGARVSTHCGGDDSARVARVCGASCRKGKARRAHDGAWPAHPIITSRHVPFLPLHTTPPCCIMSNTPLMMPAAMRLTCASSGPSLRPHQDIQASSAAMSVAGMLVGRVPSNLSFTSMGGRR
jgi:hypothetical protein